MSRFDKNFLRRASRVRYKARIKSFGKPRLSVFRSERHVYAQIIDDSCGRTLCSASTIDKTFRGGSEKAANCEAAGKVGALIARKAIDVGIKEVIFDRGGYNYHGRVKALADGARKAGLLF
ncbi:MAG: 50S ribosomal protein L18 [Holosporaceae bacterium]|jgi:large subunit ribosomal protein L18|nr:50S ribosomal protein L18 [Holosporaceae bacterium]